MKIVAFDEKPDIPLLNRAWFWLKCFAAAAFDAWLTAGIRTR